MKRLFITIILAVSASCMASAQEFATTYFLDNNLYSYRINPAIPGEKGFASIGIGNVNLSFGSNVGISSILYPNNGKLVTGFHPDISSETFLNNLPRSMRLDQVFNENLIAVGFWTKKGAFHSIEVNVKEDIFAGLPKDLFAMVKCGSSEIPYDISNVSALAKSYSEIAYGYTRKLNDKFSVGGRFKFLIGLTAADVSLNKGLVTMSDDMISADIEAKFRMSSSFMEIQSNPSDPRFFDFSAFNINLNNLNPCGWGAAIDLGVSYKPIKGLSVDFSIIDLGGIGWKYNIVGKSSGNPTFTGITLNDSEKSEEEMNKILKEFEKIADFEKAEGGESSFDMLSCTLQLGARYNMPFYERLSVGLLTTYKIDKYNPYIGGRLGATVTPVDWLSITGNYGINNYCWTYGAAISINAANLNFIFGYEGYSGKVSDVKISSILSPVVTPLGSFQNMVRFGINVTFGKRRNNFTPIGTSFIHGKKAEIPSALASPGAES